MIPINIETLRRQADDARAADIESHCREGEDPHEFLPEIRSVDEEMVMMLRPETIEAHHLEREYARAYHPAATEADARQFEYQLLRRIAMDRPSLACTVWTMLGRLNAA